MTIGNGQQSSGLLLVGHGTRDAVGTRQFFKLARLVEEQIAPIPVKPCLLELQDPTIEQGWRELIADGVSHVHVSPLLLFSAGHAKHDIPDAIANAAKQDPHVSFDFARPLSRHAAIVHLAIERIGARLDALPSDDRVAVVMVGRGSHDPCARSDMYVLSGIVQHKLKAVRPLSHGTDVATCFYAMAEPKLPNVLEEVCNRSGAQHIVVYAHLLFEGRLYQAIRQQVSDAAKLHPNLTFHICDYLGPDPKLAEAIWQRALNCPQSV